MTDRHIIWQLLDELQMNNRADAAKLTTLRSYVASLDLPAPSEVTCPECGIKRAGLRTLAEHMHQMHNGPLPDHWADLDSQVADVTPATDVATLRDTP